MEQFKDILKKIISTQRNYKKLLIVFGLISILGILYTSLLAPRILKIGMNLVGGLRGKSPVRKLWERVPFSINFKIIIWNITNPDDFILGEKPILNEVGPYFFE